MAAFTDSVTLEELNADPYPVYARMRRELPVAYLPATEEWLITRWDDCAAVAQMTTSFSPSKAQIDEFMGTPNILRMSGPEHSDLRAGIDARLRPAAVKSYIDDLARPVVLKYIEAIRDRGSADLTTELFEPISVRVVGTVVGLGDLDDPTLIRWFKDLSAGTTNRVEDEGTASAAANAVSEIDAELRNRIERLTHHPDDSVLSHMVHAGAAERPRKFEDLISSIRIILLGGLQEPGHGIANTFHGLLGEPRQLDQLVANPVELAPLAVQEGLRWIAPIGIANRTTSQPTYIGRQVIPPGQPVALAVASANRDESRFNDPDRYDFHRTQLPNATFGYGRHMCAGHFLSRSLMEITVAETARLLPGLRRASVGAAITKGFDFRGVAHLPAEWDA